MIAKSVLLYLSRQERLKNLVTHFSAFQNLTRRFVAGETIDDAVAAIRKLNSKGITASFDHLGESITSPGEARAEVDEYRRLLSRIESERLDCNVSIKLTQLGLDIDPKLCLENAGHIVEEAEKRHNFVRIDMEDSEHTQSTLEVFTNLRRRSENVGIVLQAYLYRTRKDLEDMLAAGARVRLCKGAYNEPASVAFAQKSATDHNYIELTRILLASDSYHGIATHDEAIIAATKRFVEEQAIGRDHFEFQMLYGVRRDLQEQLVRDGYRLRVYVPYGKHWYPYFMRRLAERPANIWFVLKNLLREEQRPNGRGGDSSAL